MTSSSTPPSDPSATAPGPRDAESSRHASALSAETLAEIDAAMAQLDAEDAAGRRAKARPDKPRPDPRPLHNVQPLGGAAPPALRGPRVVQAGREHRPGLVVSVGPTDIFIEFGPKELGVVPRLGWPEDQLPKVGDTIEVVVDRFEAGESLYLCSRPGAVQKADWELLEAGQVIEARVTGVNKGGLDLEVAGHRAFMPAGQVGLDRIPDLSVLVGEKITCKVQRVDRAGRGNIVLSRREILIEQRKEEAAKLKERLAEGQTVEGIVRKIMPFGAFVDLGGVDGLVHISDMTYDRVGFGEKAVAKYIQEGQKVQVRILKLDWEQDRISLGLKQVQGDPFVTASNAMAEGADVTGRVVSITEFGAFVEIAPGVQGLVHISEIDHKRIGKVEDALKKDEIVTARILKIDPGSRRISLSIKATKPLPEVTFGAGEKQPPGKGGPGGPGGPRGGPRGFGGRGRRDEPGRSMEEINKETPALRRAREKFKKFQFKGGLG